MVLKRIYQLMYDFNWIFMEDISLLQAVCCEDKLHCCPEATKCDLAHSKCVSSSLESFPMLEKLPAKRRDNHSGRKIYEVTC